MAGHHSKSPDGGKGGAIPGLKCRTNGASTTASLDRDCPLHVETDASL